MNIIDLMIIIILGICVLYGAYRGFLHSLFSLGASLLSLLVSFAFVPSLVKRLSANANVVNLVKYYTDTAAKINGIDAAAIPQDNMISSALDRLQLASPIDQIIKSVISGRDIASSSELNDIISQAIISIAINVLAFIACYFLIYIVFSMIINLLNSVFRFSQLKYADMLFGAALGLAKGIVFVFVIFTIMPVLQNALPFDELKQIFAQSEYYHFFVSSDLIIKILQL